ncbi:MAG: myo-inositol-1(or 4)-monophosphatase, partial [Mariniblastus sp.]
MLNQLEPHDLAELEKSCCEAAQLGGAILKKWLGKTTPKSKGDRDWVTQADLESQRVIREFLHQRFPDHRFIGEESIDETPSGSPTSEFCWIVDPLDGTTNYIHQLPSFAVSVAVYQNQTALAGAVFDPLVDECFSAANGQGAKRNGTSIQTSP